ncbi:MAG: hypothetical protein AAF960_22495 [Bacteroidota bacterium]
MSEELKGNPSGASDLLIFCQRMDGRFYQKPPTKENKMEIITNPNYWDCECEENFIHPKTVTECPNGCEYDEEFSPDSRENEIDLLLKNRTD